MISAARFSLSEVIAKHVVAHEDGSCIIEEVCGDSPIYFVTLCENIWRAAHLSKHHRAVRVKLRHSTFENQNSIMVELEDADFEVLAT